jgi:hypothetical protein
MGLSPPQQPSVVLILYRKLTQQGWVALPLAGAASLRVGESPLCSISPAPLPPAP